MKKGKLAVVAMLLLVTVLSLAGCGKKEKCSICGETKSGKSTEVFGEKVFICNDCQKQLDSLLGN